MMSKKRWSQASTPVIVAKDNLQEAEKKYYLLQKKLTLNVLSIEPYG